jgi:hypothetical protein
VFCHNIGHFRGLDELAEPIDIIPYLSGTFIRFSIPDRQRVRAAVRTDHLYPGGIDRYG